MNRILILGLVIAAAQGQINNIGTKTGNNDVDKKFITLPGLDAGTSNLLIGGALGAGATLLGQQVLGGNNNNPCPPGFGRRKRQAEEPNKKIFGLFDGLLGGNSNNNCVPYQNQNTNPCGRKKRQASGTDTGEKVDTKFFGLFDGILGGNQNSNPCYTGNYQQPQGQGYQQGYNQGYNSGFQNGASSSSQGNYQNQGSNQVIRVCQCTNYSKTDRYGNEEAKCAQADHTGRKWCYSTSSSQCSDAQQSSKYPRNPWSYEACNNFGK